MQYFKHYRESSNSRIFFIYDAVNRFVTLMIDINTNGVENGSIISNLNEVEFLQPLIPTYNQSMHGLGNQSSGIGRIVLTVSSDGFIFMNSLDYDELIFSTHFTLIYSID